MKLDIVLSGVGGQGLILASRVLGQAAVEAGLEVRTSEQIGMAQREGAVSSHVRLGRGLWGGIIPDGGADAILGFELAEAVRALPKLKPGGLLVASTGTLIPVTTALGLSAYSPGDLRAYLQSGGRKACLIEAEALAARAGSPKALNLVLLGALAAFGVLPFSAEQLKKTALSLVPGRQAGVNGPAFDLGYQSGIAFVG